MSQRDNTLREIFEALAVMKRTVHSHFQSTYEALALSPAQVEILFTIHFAGSLSHKELAKRLLLTPGAVSQLLEALDDTGYITRTPSTSDRRVSYLSISTAGKQVIDNLMKTRQAVFTAAFAAASDEELATYLHVQQKMLAYFEGQQKPTVTAKQKEL